MTKTVEINRNTFVGVVFTRFTLDQVWQHTGFCFPLGAFEETDIETRKPCKYQDGNSFHTKWYEKIVLVRVDEATRKYGFEGYEVK